MRIRPYVYATLALCAASPSLALAAVTVATTTIQAPPGNVPPGSTVSVICRAEGNTVGGMASSTRTTIDRIDVSVTGGTVSPTQFTGAVSRTCTAGSGTCSWLEGTASWTAPATAGTYTASCTVYSTNTNSLGASAPGTPVTSSAPLTTVNVTFLPPVVGALTGPNQVAAGATAVFEVTASDPNGWPLTYAWSATGGTITPDASNGARAAWTAPAALGSYSLTVSVSDGPFTVPASKAVDAVLASYQAGLPLPMVAPRRLAVGNGGTIYVVDGRQGTATGEILLATARGEARGFAALPEPALAVAAGGGALWVTTSAGNVYKIDPVTGRNLGKIALADGPFVYPFGIAYDPNNARLWIADKDADCVRVVTVDGATVAYIDSVNGGRLLGPVDVAIDPVGGKAWVVVLQAKSAPSAGEPIEVTRFVHAFDLSGQWVASYVGAGGAVGQLTRAGGVAVTATRVYLSDLYQGTVQVLASSGVPISTIGTWGEVEGQLMNPTGLAIIGNGDLAVANSSLARIDRFGTGAALPICAGDSDCDLLPDEWEIAHGLDPNWAGDALLDGDGDGLNTAEEFAANTDPRNRDTDGDGFSDADELASGFDPTNPDDHKAMVAASGPTETAPGLVKLHATASGPTACTVAWSQKGGPGVTLGGSDSAEASFVARAAGTYAFDAVATCGTFQSAPGRATVVVKNVAPHADAGGVVVATPGAPIRLDAQGSSDANGDALAFTWDQTLGAPIVGTSTSGSLTVRPRGAGLYGFQVTVADPGGQATTVEVPVLVAEGQAPTAIATAIPAAAEIGATVTLDASTSIVYQGSTFSWTQLGGPTATLVNANQPVASFVPTSAGRYTFDIVAGAGPMRTPPARVDVFVAEAGGTLPTITAAAPSIVAVGQPVSLEATPGPATAQVTWRQVSGPAAGLTEADRATATVVPFSPGFHVFEAGVRDGNAEGRSARVAFEARLGGAEIPQARVAVPPGDAWVGQLVFLDGRGSSGAARFRWTQVAGPWVAFATQGSVATFRPLAAGVYSFELVVDDGVTRSAPARVDVNVVPAEVQ